MSCQYGPYVDCVSSIHSELLSSRGEVVFQTAVVPVQSVLSRRHYLVVHRQALRHSNQSLLLHLRTEAIEVQTSLSLIIGYNVSFSIDEGRDSEVESLPIRRVCSGQATDRLQEPRIQTTPSSADNELMAKLMRRQNKISELEAAAATEQPPHECEETEAVQSKPPPPPQRKTPALNTPPTQPQPSQPPPTQPPPTQPPPTQLPSQSPETAPSETTFRQKKVVKPPLSKPKEAEPEMMPWQQELAARRARMAENESQEPEVELVTSTEVQEKAASPAPVARPAKPAPKPKRNKVPPPSAHLPQELPPPPPPPMSQPQPPPQPLIQPPQLLPSTEPVAVMRQEPVVVVEESEHPAMPIASMAAIDQCKE